LSKNRRPPSERRERNEKQSRSTSTTGGALAERRLRTADGFFFK